MTNTQIQPLYYNSIHQLPLNKFIDCIVDNNISALTIEGFPSPQQLAEAWETILAQYTEIVGTQEYRLYKETAVLKIQIDQINMLAHRGNDELQPGILRMVYDEDLAKELNSLLKTNCRFNYLDPKSYHAELDKCINRSKALKIQLDLKNLRFKAIQEKNSKHEKKQLDRQYFISILITLSDFAKYRIEENIKMSEYCERLKRFADYCDQQAKK